MYFGQQKKNNSIHIKSQMKEKRMLTLQQQKNNNNNVQEMGKAGETKQKNAFANLSGQISKGRGNILQLNNSAAPRPTVDLSVVSLIL